MMVDMVMAFLIKHDIPVNRQNYLDVMYMGTPPEVLDAEEELSLPEQFQLEPPEAFDKT